MEFNIAISIGQIRILQTNSFIDRPTIIFLHDSLGCIELWRDFPSKLGELTNCNILVYDRQGYGKSSPFSSEKRENNYMAIEAELLLEILTTCNIDNVILFGHSDGGSISLLFGSMYPTKVLGIITEGAHIFVENITVNGIKEAVKAYQSTSLKTKLEKYHQDKTEDMFWAWAKTWLTDDFRSWNIESYLPSIICPTLIIQGEDDEFGSMKQVDAIVQLTKGTSTKLVLKNIKHTPHKEAPELLLSKVSEFIENLHPKEQINY